MSKNKDKEVTFIEDPFNLPNVELHPDGNDLSRIEKALSEQQKKDEEALENITKESMISPEEELKEQIEEDQELEKQLKKEEQELDPEVIAALPKATTDGDLDLMEVQSCIEAILFVSDKPLSKRKVRELLSLEMSNEDTKKVFKNALKTLLERYQSPEYGIELVEVAGGLQFRTKPGRAALAKLLAKTQSHRLSRGAMETLAIIAYNQPTLKEDIDKIRGVDSSYFLRTLLDKKLISISGRSELPGRPILYTTTTEFLEIFGINELSDMPPLQEIEQMIPTSEALNDEKSKELNQMKGLISSMKAEKADNDYDPKEDDVYLNEFKEKVKSIPISTPHLDEKKRLEKEAKKQQETS